MFLVQNEQTQNEVLALLWLVFSGGLNLRRFA